MTTLVRFLANFRLEHVGEFSDAVAVVFPVEWDTFYAGPTLPLQHTTILYLGRFADINFTADEVVKALSLVDLNIFVWAEVTGKAMLGPDSDVPVLLVENPVVHKIHDMVEGALARVGIHSASSFPDYLPHITVNEEIFATPPTNAMLLPAQLWWGDERISLDSGSAAVHDN